MQVVEAEVPVAEMSDFSTFIKQITQGRGSYEFSFVRYEDAPANIAQKVIEQAKKKPKNNNRFVKEDTFEGILFC